MARRLRGFQVGIYTRTVPFLRCGYSGRGAVVRYRFRALTRAPNSCAKLKIEGIDKKGFRGDVLVGEERWMVGLNWEVDESVGLNGFWKLCVRNFGIHSLA